MWFSCVSIVYVIILGSKTTQLGGLLPGDVGEGGGGAGDGDAVVFAEQLGEGGGDLGLGDADAGADAHGGRVGAEEGDPDALGAGDAGLVVGPVDEGAAAAVIGGDEEGGLAGVLGDGLDGFPELADEAVVAVGGVEV